MGAALWGMAEQAQNEGFDIDTEARLGMFFAVDVANVKAVSRVAQDAPLGDRAPANVASHIFQYAMGLGISGLNLHMPFLSAEFIEQIEALLNGSARRGLEDILWLFEVASGGAGVEPFLQIGDKLSTKFGG